MKLIMTTGISGCGDKEYLEKFVSYCGGRGKKVKVFYVGSMMEQHARELGFELHSENIRNTDPDLLHSWRSNVFTQIGAEINKNPDYDAVVICIHAFFYWKGVWNEAYDRFWGRFTKEFPPDMYITFIDDYRNILLRLSQRPQWRREKLSPAEVLSWQNIEVCVTKGWTSYNEKPYYALGTPEPVSTLYKLIFHPEIEPVYVQMPISHFRDPKAREPINRFIERLHKYFTVFNPLSVEIVGAASVDDFHTQERQIINNHVVNRDLYWFVRQTQKSIVIWPGPVSSPGVDHETHEAFVKTKDVWVVFLGKEASPFITYFNTGFFSSEEEFFSFLDEKYPERKNFVW